MFRIDKSLVNKMSMNKSFVMITHEENVKEEKKDEQLKKVVEPSKDDQTITKNAIEEARRILNDANTQAEEIKKQAWNEGYKQGSAEAQRRSNQILQVQEKKVSDFLHRLKDYEQSLYEEIQSSILDLSMDVAEKIVNKELKKDDKVYVGIIKKAVSSFKDSERFKLRVSQSEYDKYFLDGVDWLKDETGQTLIEVICDPNMKEGDCVVESGQTIINAGIPLQLNKIKRQLSKETDNGQ